MAKLRSVTDAPFLPRSEDEFLAAAPTTSALPSPVVVQAFANDPPTARVDNVGSSEAPTAADDLVALTIRVPRRMRDALAARADADDRSISKIACRLLAPLLET